jgi:hypothetical protein
MLGPAGIEPGLGEAGRRDPVPPSNPNANCQAAGGSSRILSGPGSRLPASDRTKTATLAHLAEPFVVLVLIVGTAVAAWVHLRSSSIWYDEAGTLLITSGHAKLEWSRGLSQFTPSANLGKMTRGGSCDAFARMSRLSRPSVCGSPTWPLAAAVPRQLSDR